MSLFSSSLFCGNNKSSFSTNNQSVKKEEVKPKEDKIYNNNKLLDYHMLTEQNYPFKNTNEDFVYSELNLLNLEGMNLFALYDGHGGSEAVEYLNKRMPNLIKSKLAEKLINNNKENREDLISQVLLTCFRDVNRELRFTCPETAGTTATVVLLFDNKVICANVGDSKAVIYNYKTKESKILTEMHLVSNESEKNRVIKSGGKIDKGRVNGVLVVTRSLGDHILQDKGVICDPYISINKINLNEEYLIICSDGVWDVVNENSLEDYIQNDKSCKDICISLVDESKKLGSKDNISSIIIKL